MSHTLSYFGRLCVSMPAYTNITILLFLSEQYTYTIRKEYIWIRLTLYWVQHHIKSSFFVCLTFLMFDRKYEGFGLISRYIAIHWIPNDWHIFAWYFLGTYWNENECFDNHTLERQTQKYRDLYYCNCYSLPF